MGGSIKKAFSNPIRAATAVGTFGTSELARRMGGPVGQLARLPETASDSLLGTRFGREGAPDLPGVAGGQDPATMLAQTGGAPVLANIAMGVAPKDALAGYFGKSTKDGSWEEFLGTLNQKDLDAVNSVHGQLTTIQSSRELRQQAVDKVVQDFPNIAQQAAQARSRSGEEFDQVTKGYMDQALGQTAAKFAAGGNLSSGAANEAFARVGAEQGMNKLNFMGEREQNAYNMGANELNARLGEVNALRDFQNTMLGQGVQQGFSAQQANLQRQFQGNMANAEIANQRAIADQQGKNQIFGSILGLGGTMIGAKILGAQLFGSAAAASNSSPDMTGKFNQLAPMNYTTSYGRILGNQR